MNNVLRSLKATDNPFNRIPHELWLILASVNGGIDKTKDLLLKPVNWDYLFHLAVHHRVYPLVYKTFSQIDNLAIPNQVLGLLRQKYNENAMQALSMTGETVRMVQCFELHGINPVVLKGAPLAWRLYGDIAIRPSKDIDILVSPNDLEKAAKIMEDEGYSRIENEHNLTPRQLEIFLKAHTHSLHLDYWHSKKRINLELHWKLVDRGYAFTYPNESRINRIEVAGRTLPVLADEEWLLYLMLHGAVHGWFRLRWLVDIARFTQLKGLDWEMIVFLARGIGMQTILNQSLILANRLLAVAIPPSVLKVVANDKSAWRLTCMAMDMCLAIADSEIKGSNNKPNKFIYDFQVRKGWKSSLKYVLKFMGPTVNDIKLISLPDRLYELYYVLRPFTMLVRRMQKFRAKD